MSVEAPPQAGGRPPRPEALDPEALESECSDSDSDGPSPGSADPAALTDQVLEGVVRRLDGRSADPAAPMARLVGLLPREGAICELLKLATVNSEPYAGELQRLFVEAGAVVGLLVAAVRGRPESQRKAKLALSAMAIQKRIVATPCDDRRPGEERPWPALSAPGVVASPSSSPSATPRADASGTPSSIAKATVGAPSPPPTPPASPRGDAPATPTKGAAQAPEEPPPGASRGVSALKALEAALDPSRWTLSPKGLRGGAALPRMALPKWATRLGA